jgi:hypothetical protein
MLSSGCVIVLTIPSITSKGAAMPWTWEEINRVWYRGPAGTELPVAEECVALFNVVDRYFGREWLDEE